MASKLDPDLVRHAYIAKNAPSEHEIGWLGHKRFKGDEKHVQIKFDPSDPEIQDKFTYHTHPADEPTPLTALPSEQDLIAAAMATDVGLRGIVIFSGNFYTVIVPTERVKGGHFKQYIDCLSRGDIEDAIKELEKAGFDVETGKL